MYLTFKRFLAWGLIACLPLVVAGCGGGGGGGGGGGATPLTTISGIAVKGPIKGAVVQIYQLKTNGTADELLGSGLTGDDGRYAVQIPASRAVPPLLIRVTGQTGAVYTSESSGNSVNFTAGESFNAMVDTLAANVAVSPLSEAAYQKLQQILTVSPTILADARVTGAVNALVAKLFNVSDLLADPNGNIANQAALLVIDQMVVDSGANTLAVMNTINRAFTDTTQPDYQVYLTALVAASNKVLAAIPAGNQALVTAVQTFTAKAATPPAEPDFTDTIAPTAPADLTATATAVTADASSVTLAWTASTDNNAVTGYEIYRDSIRIATVATPGYIDPAVVPGISHTYFVIALDGAGNRSANSNAVSISPTPANLGVIVSGQLSGDILSLPQVLDLTRPTPPTGLFATTSSISATDSAVVLKWTAATDNKGVTGYEIFRNGSKVGTSVTTGFTDASVPSAATYSYFVVALDAAGNRSLASGQISVTPPAAPLGIIVNGQITGI